MAKFKKRFVASFLVGTMLFGSVSGVVSSQGTKVVYAQSLNDIEPKVNHLVKSMQTNYLGIKNQGTWERYLYECYDLLYKISEEKLSTSDRNKYYELYGKLGSCRNLISVLASINQVEKSMQPKSEGGYGNYIGIKNVEVWKAYLEMAMWYLDNPDDTDMGIFYDQYSELIKRLKDVTGIINKIEAEYNIDYDKVEELFNEAKKADDEIKVQTALIEAKKLGQCSKSNNLIFNINRFIEKKNPVNFLKYKLDYSGAIIEYPDTFKVLFRDDEVIEIKTSDIDMRIDRYNNLYAHDGHSYYSEYIEHQLKGKVVMSNATEDFMEVCSIYEGKVTYTKVLCSNSDMVVLKISYPESKLDEYKDVMDYIKDSYKLIPMSSMPDHM